MLSKIPFYPFIFVTHFVFFLYVYNYHEAIPFRHTLLPLTIVLTSTLFFFLFLSIFRKRLGWERIGLLTFLFAIFLFLKPHLYTLAELKAPIWSAIPDRLIILGVYAILGLIGFFIIRIKISSNVTFFLNAFSLGLILTLYFQFLGKVGDRQKVADCSFLVRQDWEKVQLSQKPNIYYFILDSYPREDILRDWYQYDNREFLEFLKEKQFYVADSAKSNYMMTYLSICSILNQMYLDTLMKPLGVKSIERAPFYAVGTNNLTTLALKKQGYQYYHLSSGWGYTNSNPNADKNYAVTLMNEFTSLFYKSTAFSHLESKIQLSRKSERFRFESSIDSIQAATQDSVSPKFVFCHFFPPHPPYIFDEHGNLPKFSRDIIASVGYSNRKMFVSQLKYVNKRIKELIQKICENDPNGIILLHSDHGMNTCGPIDRVDLISDSLICERSRILLAFRIPNLKDSTALKPTLTPVNLFRIVFNELGFPKQELLEDIAYFSTYDRPYRLRIVKD